MIAQLSGTLSERALDHVVVDVSGVGFRLVVSLQTLAQLPQVGQSARLLTYLHVREDALVLFGFAGAAERTAFELLISVQQVGPKLAMAILSALDPAELRACVEEGKHARLQKIPGVGKKTAERLVLELRDKFDKVEPARAAHAPSSAQVSSVVSALTNLGYRKDEAERAVAAAEKATPSASVEQLLKQALRHLAE
jgi:Holliday junction DNA helicase RuvA